MSKKHFCYSLRESKWKNHGYEVEVTIYELKKNEPVFVGFANWHTGSFRGGDSEVMNKLIELGLIPKKYYNYSESDWRGAGYYCPEVAEHYVIHNLTTSM